VLIQYTVRTSIFFVSVVWIKNTEIDVDDVVTETRGVTWLWFGSDDSDDSALMTDTVLCHGFLLS
jgi:hypothetical protein